MSSDQNQDTKTDSIVAYFDFDGTLSDRDTLLPFLIYVVGWAKFLYLAPRLIIILLKYWCKVWTNEQAKERTLCLVLGGFSAALLEKLAKDFALTRLNKYIKPEIYARLEWHREHMHTLILVSANLAIYLRYWAKLHCIDQVLATEILVPPSGIISGMLQTRNCYAKEKVRRIKQFLAQEHLSFSYSYAYGDSLGDKEMLDYVDEAYLVNGTQFSARDDLNNA